MNKQRRKELTRAIKLIEEAKAIVEEVGSEEQDARDNLPDSLQDSEQAERMDDATESLCLLEEEIQTQADTLQEVIDA